MRKHTIVNTVSVTVLSLDTMEISQVGTLLGVNIHRKSQGVYISEVSLNCDAIIRCAPSLPTHV